MDFGLNIALTLTDRATSGIQRFATGLEQLQGLAQGAGASTSAALSALSASTGMLGDSFLRSGGKVISTLNGIVSHLSSVGQEVYGARLSLGKLYSEAGGTQNDLLKNGEAVVDKIQQYAAKSVFNFEDLIPVVRMLKANGIEAFDAIATSTYKATKGAQGYSQTLMDYAADLAAFNPQMRNTYGTGIKAAMGALNEYIAEGNKRSLKAGASLDITSILGQGVGKSIEERSQQVADLLEKLNMVGMVKNMQGTPQQMLANLEDILFIFKSKIADSGITDEFAKTVGLIGNYLGDIPSDEITSIAKTIGEALSLLFKPIQALIRGLTSLLDCFRVLIKERPKIAKFIVVLSGISGVGLVLVGVLLKLVSGFSGLASVMQFSALTGSSFFTMFRSGVASMISSLMPLIAILGLFVLVWKTDMFGIQTSVSEFVSNLTQSFTNARDAVESTTSDMMATFNRLRSEDNFFGNLTISIMKFMLVFKALGEAWKDYSITAETYEKLQALGLDNLVGYILDFKYRVERLWEGFKQGWIEVGETIKKVIGSIGASFKGTRLEGFFNTLTNFFDFLTDNDPEKWKDIGKALGKIAPFILTIVGALTMFNRVSKVTSSVGGIFGFLSSGSTGGTNSVLSKGLNPVTILKSMANIGIILSGLTILITAFGALSSIRGFNEFISNGATVMGMILNVLKDFFSVKLAAVFVGISLFGLIPTNLIALGFINLATVLGSFTLLISAFAALSKIPGFNEFLKSGGTTLSILIQQISKIVGVSAKVFTEAITGGLPVLGKNLSDFAQNLKPFFGVVKDVPLKEIGDFAEALGSFALKSSISSLISKVAGDSNFMDVGDSLKDFGKSIIEFFSIASTFNKTGIENSSLAFEALSNIGNYAFRQGGFMQFATGEVNIENIAKQLNSASESLGKFFESASGYNEVGLEKAPKVFKALEGIGDFDFKSGGLAQMAMGETSIDNIGRELATFAPNGEKFFEAVANYNEQGMQKAPKVFEALEGIGDYDFKSGGLAQLMGGETDFGGIGRQLVSFAPNGEKFFNFVANYNQAGIDKAPKVFEALRGLGDYDFKTGGILQLITGSTDLGDIGEQLTDFSENAKGFFDTMATLSPTAIDNGGKAINAISQIGSFRSGGLLERIAGEIDLEKVGEQLTEFGENSLGFFNTVAGIPAQAFYNGGRVFEVLAKTGDSAFRDSGFAQLFTGSVSIENIGSQLTEFGKNVSVFFTTVEKFNDKQFENAVKTFDTLKKVDPLIDTALKSNGSLGTFGDDLTKLGNGVSQFMSKTSGVKESSMDGVTSALKTLVSIVGSASSKVRGNMKSMRDSFSKTASSAGTSMKNIISYVQKGSEGVLSALSKMNSDLTLVVNEIIEKLGKLDKTITTRVHITTVDNKSKNAKPKDKRAVGGVFTSATNIQVGEDGAEVVMPLEKNTGWINILANQLKSLMGGTTALDGTSNYRSLEGSDNNITPVPILDNFSNETNAGRSYDTNIRENYQSDSGSSQNPVQVDNSITFAPGSIVINSNGASESEMQKMAKYIMDYIKREQQINSISNYGVSYS